jgi:hypothetical protein
VSDKDRNFVDWIPAYVEYASVTEAPKRTHFWCAVGAVAGCLRRKVWIDMKRFMWYPSFYLIIVGPPGVIAKSTTIDIATDILRQVPGIKFGPNAITWQALVSAFAGASEAFEYQGAWHPMSPLTLVASELGSLLNLQDKDMINLLIEMWDGKKTYEKITKMSGNDIIEGPWINMMAGTTPHWIADNMPAAMIGGGLSSRCIFIYGDTKERYTAYVDEMVKDGDDARRVKLIEDLERIAMLTGRYTITPEAREWGRDWYERFWKAALSRMDDVMLEGYAARKQTHIHKVAMVLSASRSNDLIIKREDLELANFMLEDLEKDMHRVFSRIGRTEDSLQAEKLIDMLRRKGDTSYADAYKLVYHTFPDAKDFEGILQGAINSGQLYIKSTPQGVMICATQIVVPAKTIITPDTVV